MKNVGILLGSEGSFPQALLHKLNELGEGKLYAEFVQIGSVTLSQAKEYEVLVDRISDLVPFYKSYVNLAERLGTYVLNTPTQVQTLDKFLALQIAESLQISVAKTALLPSKEQPSGTFDTSFKNLKYPLDWPEIFDYVQFPATLMPNQTTLSAYKRVQVENPEDLWDKQRDTGQQVMLLQEHIAYDVYFRCYCIGSNAAKVVPYEPQNPSHLRYATQLAIEGEEAEKLLNRLSELALKVHSHVGLDCNMVEIVKKEDQLIVIDAYNPIPDMDVYSVGKETFDWLVDETSKLVISIVESI